MEENNLTVVSLDLACRMVGISLSTSTISKIIDLVQLIEAKGSETTIQDVCRVQASWEKSA